MKKISNWSLAGMAIGGIYAVGAFWRYYVMYPDLSEVVTGVAIGVTIFGLAFMYNKMIEQQHTLEALEEFLADKTSKKI